VLKFAFNAKRLIIPISRAEKNVFYTCVECGKKLIPKLNAQSPHFAHAQEGVCRQTGTSLTHTQTQRYLQALFPCGTCFLEYPFPKLGRIADVYCPKRKFVFDVLTRFREELEGKNGIYFYNGRPIEIIECELIDNYHENKYISKDGFYYYTLECVVYKANAKGRKSGGKLVFIKIGFRKSGKEDKYRIFPLVSLQFPDTDDERINKQIKDSGLALMETFVGGFVGSINDMIDRYNIKYGSETNFFAKSIPQFFQKKRITLQEEIEEKQRTLEIIKRCINEF